MERTHAEYNLVVRWGEKARDSVSVCVRLCVFDRPAEEVCVIFAVELVFTCILLG